MGVPYGIEVSCSHFDFALWPFLFGRRLLGVGHMIVKIVANRIEAGPTGSMPSQGGRFLFHQISWVSRCAIPGVFRYSGLPNENRNELGANSILLLSRPSVRSHFGSIVRNRDMTQQSKACVCILADGK